MQEVDGFAVAISSAQNYVACEHLNRPAKMLCWYQCVYVQVESMNMDSINAAVYLLACLLTYMRKCLRLNVIM